MLAAVTMDVTSLREVDYTYDKIIYGIPGATVIDVNVTKDTASTSIPDGMEQQADKYYQAIYNYNYAILSVYADLQRARRENLNITREFHRLLVDAYRLYRFYR